MDDIRASLSKTKKRFKNRLTGRKRKPDGTGASASGEGTDSASSLPQPESHVAADEGRALEVDRSNAAEEQVFSTGLPQPDGPESAPARGGDNGREGDAGIDGRERTSQSHSNPHPDVEVAVGSGRGEELEGVGPSPSTPWISHGGKPNSTRTYLFWLPPLITPSDNAGDSTLPECEPEVVRPDETIEPSVAVDEKKSSCKPTASATAGLLRGVRDSAGAFGPLKSVARSLCFVLENCEVWPPSRMFDPQYLRSFQRTDVNEYAIESLAPRVKTLSEDLSVPIPPGDVNEKERTNELEQ